MFRRRAPCPNVLWCPTSYVVGWASFVNVAFIIDGFAKRTVGWRISRTPEAGFALEKVPYTR